MYEHAVSLVNKSQANAWTEVLHYFVNASLSVQTMEHIATESRQVILISILPNFPILRTKSNMILIGF